VLLNSSQFALVFDWYATVNEMPDLAKVTKEVLGDMPINKKEEGLVSIL
jgi:hypothetical protein